MNYNLIPIHCRADTKRYIEEGQLPGGFLQAVICNNLVEAFARADDINQQSLRDYANFLYNEAPASSWGSREAMEAWSFAGGLSARRGLEA